jgi:hypothetical protein
MADGEIEPGWCAEFARELSGYHHSGGLLYGYKPLEGHGT